MMTLASKRMKTSRWGRARAMAWIGRTYAAESGAGAGRRQCGASARKAHNVHNREQKTIAKLRLCTLCAVYGLLRRTVRRKLERQRSPSGLPAPPTLPQEPRKPRIPYTTVAAVRRGKWAAIHV